MYSWLNLLWQLGNIFCCWPQLIHRSFLKMMWVLYYLNHNNFMIFFFCLIVFTSQLTVIYLCSFFKFLTYGGSDWPKWKLKRNKWISDYVKKKPKNIFYWWFFFLFMCVYKKINKAKHKHKQKYKHKKITSRIKT